MRVIGLFVFSFLLPVFTLSQTGKSSPANNSDSNREFLYALMEEKFIFFERLLYIEEQPQEERREILQRSTQEIAFMEQLTGIVSIEKQPHHLDKMFIQEKDYIAWTVWYFKHKPFIIWDKNLKKILIKRP